MGILQVPGVKGKQKGEIMIDLTFFAVYADYALRPLLKGMAPTDGGASLVTVS